MSHLLCPSVTVSAGTGLRVGEPTCTNYQLFADIYGSVCTYYSETSFSLTESVDFFITEYFCSSLFSCSYKSINHVRGKVRCWEGPVSAFDNAFHAMVGKELNHLFRTEIVE